ncbi:uncharacterized protein LOC102078049 isoform X2 [Oreochromis niloticus]|uniref:uncharacterized protein LOC102078049 isoform X2 n=1 Tax=Oreochromis niloticus TaxID=8128 RepID=UPI0009051F15|nr:uncharacterized protein LOC102078049 isoform X2 [Oreochromis niloticus]
MSQRHAPPAEELGEREEPVLPTEDLSEPEGPARPAQPPRPRPVRPPRPRPTRPRPARHRSGTTPHCGSSEMCRRHWTRGRPPELQHHHHRTRAGVRERESSEHKFHGSADTEHGH